MQYGVPQEWVVPGYDCMNTNMCMFPPMQLQVPPEVIKFQNSQDVKPATAEEAKALLIKWVSNQGCCVGHTPAEEVKIKSCEGFAAMVCELETFVEIRSTRRAVKPYKKGTPYDSPKDGQPPQPWQMACPTQQYFSESEQLYEVPHTATVCQCGNCGGDGQITCKEGPENGNGCGGDGTIKCSTCQGDGKVRVNKDGHSHEEKCSRCGGDGKIKCHVCGGDGKKQCPSCTGLGMVKWFIEMVRVHKTFKNIKSIDNINDRELSGGEIASMRGDNKPIIETKGVNIAPPRGFSQEVDTALQEIKDFAVRQRDDSQAYQHQEKIRLSMVPVTRVVGTHDEKEILWFVVGQDRHVKCQNYPAMCCWGCEIM